MAYSCHPAISAFDMLQDNDGDNDPEMDGGLEKFLNGSWAIGRYLNVPSRYGIVFSRLPNVEAKDPPRLKHE